MDLPQPPQDTELRNIIDKLAQFVARNGPDFEQMTKNKQKGNSKFQFLFGGEYFNYYQYKVTTEQAIYKQQQQSLNTTNNQDNWTQPPAMLNVNTQEIEQINQQQEALREQIKQSEQNLTAQHTVLLQQQQAQVEIVVSKAENEELQREADNCEIFLEDIYNILQPIIDNCTKDSISNGKNWILQHATSGDRALCILHCLLIKVIQGSKFPQKLHVIYLVNDIMHHCARKNSVDLKAALEATVVPMFCNANIGANEDQKGKLDKLLKLWESKLNFLGEDLVKQMRNPAQTYKEYQAQKMAKYSDEIAALAQQTKVTFDGYQSQHQAYVCHAMQQIVELQQQKHVLEHPPPLPPTPAQTTPSLMSLENLQTSFEQMNQNNIEIQQSNDFQQISNNAEDYSTNNDNYNNDNYTSNDNYSSDNYSTDNYSNNDSYIHQIPPLFPPPNMNSINPINPVVCQPSNGMEHPFSMPPPGFFPPPGVFPDFSKPPPGFPPIPEPLLEDLLPANPYYDLPAGLMVPLIKLEDTAYKPLDPKDIRLPPPAPPNDRLLAALDAYYAAPTHERPRDSEGWEKLGLYEYYKAKNNAKREKDDQIAGGLRPKSRSPSPVLIAVVKDPSPPRRRYASKSPSPPPPPPQPPSSSHRSRRASRSRSPRSRSRSRSRSPRRRRRPSGRNRRRSHSRSPSRSPVRRSPSPVAHGGFGASNFVRTDVQELDASNKGHQMLKKMGWGGSGLGANEQGIDAPISGGDVRDRQDQFKGVGCNLNDPYENFRKNKGAAFITRMKARAEERAIENKLIDY